MEQGSFRILIADDARTDLDVLCRILMPDHRVIVAKNGPAALEKTMALMPDLILLDILMPGMSGFEILTLLKLSEQTQRIPVIIITGLDGVTDEEKGFKLGAVDYITKPFHRSLVKARVEAHLRIVEQMHMIEQLGLIDPLTGIPNRRSLDNHTALEWSRAAREGLPLSYLMIDIDHFKRYNDTFGHQQGDITLKAVAQVVKQAARRPADLAARWGGEEFAVLLPQTDACGALKLAEQIRAAVQASGAGVTVSVGVSSVVPTTEHSLEDFFGAADKALYRCKANGRNRVEGGEPT